MFYVHCLHRAILLEVSTVNTFVVQDIAHYQSRGFAYQFWSPYLSRRFIALVVEFTYAVLHLFYGKKRKKNMANFIWRGYTMTTVTKQYDVVQCRSYECPDYLWFCLRQTRESRAWMTLDISSYSGVFGTGGGCGGRKGLSADFVELFAFRCKVKKG
jgi:hypothetical protein